MVVGDSPPASKEPTMAMQRRIPVHTADVFPDGAYLVGPVEAVMDFNAGKRPDGSRPQQTDNPFTLAELRAVVESQRSRPRQHESTKVYADVTLVLGLTGVRFGELRGLRVRDVVDVPYPALVVQRSLPQSGRTGKVIVRTTTKSGRSRIVPLSDLVQPIVSSWVADKAGDDVLFPAPVGGYLLGSNWRRAVQWDVTGLGAGRTTFGTPPRRCGSPPASTSRRCPPGSGTRPPNSPSTPTGTGWEPTPIAPPSRGSMRPLGTRFR